MTTRFRKALPFFLVSLAAACTENPTPGLRAPPADRTPSPIPADLLLECSAEGVICAGCGGAVVDTDFVAEVIEVSGHVTVGAVAPLKSPVRWDDDAWLAFTDQRTGAAYPAELDDAGAYRIALFAADYTVHLNTSSSDSGSPTLGVFGAHRLRSDTSLDFDLAVRSVEGTLTMNGARLPVGRDARGIIIFNDSSSEIRHFVRLPESGDAIFSAILPASSLFDVTWSTGAAAAFVGKVGSKSAGPFLFDAKTITVRGEVTADGAMLPDDSILDGHPRASLEFVWSRPSAYSVSRVSLGELGPGAYSVDLFPGDYEVKVIANDGTKQDVFRSASRFTVCGEDAPMPTCSFSTDARFDVSVPSGAMLGERTHVMGQVDVRGLPTDGSVDLTRVGVLIASKQSVWGLSGRLTSEGTFEAWVVPGRYQITLLGGGGIGGYSILADDIRIGGSEQVFHAAIDAVRFSGELLVNGETMGDNTTRERRAALVLVGPAGASPDATSPTMVELGGEGPAVWDFLVLRNTYRAQVTTKPPMQRSPYSQDVLPVGTAELGVVDLTQWSSSSPSVELDVGVFTLVGNLKIKGDRPADELFDRHEVGLRFTDERSGHDVFARTRATDGYYSALVFEGRYTAKIALKTPWRLEAPPFGSTAVRPICTK